MAIVKVAVARTCCTAQDFLDINPTYFNKDECSGCSFYHLCNRVAEQEVE